MEGIVMLSTLENPAANLWLNAVLDYSIRRAARLGIAPGPVPRLASNLNKHLERVYPATLQFCVKGWMADPDSEYIDLNGPMFNLLTRKVWEPGTVEEYTKYPHRIVGMHAGWRVTANASAHEGHVATLMTHNELGHLRSGAWEIPTVDSWLKHVPSAITPAEAGMIVETFNILNLEGLNPEDALISAVRL
jgi:hypothetical protein